MTRSRLISVAASALLFASCGRQPVPVAKPETAAKPSAPAIAENSPTLIASVAASTTEVMEALCKEYSDSAGVEVKLNPGPSSGLAEQIIKGAPANVFLSANEKWADAVEKAGRAEAAHKLLTNGLIIVVPKGNPAGVKKPEDLLSEKVTHLALAGEQVPAGMYAEQSLKKLDLFDKLSDGGKIVRGQDVRAALSYVERGEAEAGIVYTTDVRAAPGVESVYEFDPSLHDEIVYVLVLLDGDDWGHHARKLYQFLRSPEAMETFKSFGFASLDAAAPAESAAP